MTGKKLNTLFNKGAKHALYRQDGLWYHHLKDFPGILFDENGYVLFKTKENYLSHPQLQHGHDLHVIDGIASTKDYIPFSNEDKKLINRTFSRS